MATTIAAPQTSTADPAQQVAQKSRDVIEMGKDWVLIDDLMGGTRAMRLARQRHLPMWPEEDPVAYEARLQSTTLFPGFKRTVITLAGKPFSKPLTYGEDVPPQIKELCEADCDKQKRDLHTFASELLRSTLAAGIAGILVDYPNVADNPPVTQADETEQALRPYFILVKHDQILGWRSELIAGAQTLTMLRLMENVSVNDGAFLTKIVKQVRVLEPGKWATYRQLDGGQDTDWLQFASGTTTLDEIPFVATYGERLDFMCARPPMLELAHMNVEHWQSSSDQRTILHVARVPLLVSIGINDPGFKITVGASNAVKLPDVGSDLKYVEHSGKAIEAGANDLQDLEERMRQAGAELLVPKPARVTAFQVASDNAVGSSVLQEIALGVEDALDQALQFWADFIGIPEGGHVTLFSDYAALQLTEQSMADVLKANAQHILSDETTFNELQRRGTISADIEWDDELDRISTEAPDLGQIGSYVPADPTAPVGLPGANPPAGPAIPPGSPPKLPGGAPPPPVPRKTRSRL